MGKVMDSLVVRVHHDEELWGRFKPGLAPGEDFKARCVRVARRLGEAPDGAAFSLWREGECLRGGMDADEAADALLLPKVVYGRGPDGVFNGDVFGRPMLSRIKHSKFEDRPRCDVWSFHLIQPQDPDDDLTWWADMVVEEVAALPGLTYAAVEGGKVLVRMDDREGAGWLSTLADYGVTPVDSPSLLKRLKQLLTRPYPFGACLDAREWRFAFCADGRADALDDGLLDISERAYEAILSYDHSDVSVDPREVTDLPEAMRAGGLAMLRTKRERKKLDRANQARCTTLVNFRGLLPGGLAAAYLVKCEALLRRKDELIFLLATEDVADVELRRRDLEGKLKACLLLEANLERVHALCEKLDKGCLLKGNARVHKCLVDPLTGEEVDFLIHRPNAKTEIRVEAQPEFLVGFADQHASSSVRTSSQMVFNGLLPVMRDEAKGLYKEGETAECVEQWAIDDLRYSLSALVQGKTEEWQRRAFEEAQGDWKEFYGDVEGGDATYSFRMRRLMEEVVGRGGDCRNFPSLAMKVMDTFITKLADAKSAKIRVPLPWAWKLQVVPRSKAERSGRDYPVGEGEVLVRYDEGLAVVSDEDFQGAYKDWGTNDLDDWFFCILRREVTDGRLRFIVGRHPNSLGGYRVFRLTPETEAWAEGQKRTRLVPRKGCTPEHPHFDEQDLPVPRFREADLPPTRKEAEENGWTVDAPVELEKRTFEGGYTLENFKGFLLQSMLNGATVGQFINACMVEASVRARMPRREDRVVPEHRVAPDDAIDACVKDGTAAAVEAVKAARLDVLQRVIRLGVEVDRHVALAKVPKDFREKMLQGDGRVTRFFREVLGQVLAVTEKGKAVVTEKRKEGGSHASRVWRAMKAWLLRHQTAPPQGLAAMAAGAHLAEHRKKAYGPCRELDKARRYAEYAAACVELADREGPLALLERAWLDVQKVDPLDGLLWDGRLANGAIFDEVVLPWLEENPTPLEEQLAYRLACYDARNLRRWLRGMVDAGHLPEERLGKLKAAYRDGKLLAAVAHYAGQGKVAPSTRDRLAEALALPYRREVLDAVLGGGEGDGDGGGREETPPPVTPVTAPAMTEDEAAHEAAHVALQVAELTEAREKEEGAMNTTTTGREFEWTECHQEALDHHLGNFKAHVVAEMTAMATGEDLDWRDGCEDEYRACLDALRGGDEAALLEAFSYLVDDDPEGFTIGADRDEVLAEFIQGRPGVVLKAAREVRAAHVKEGSPTQVAPAAEEEAPPVNGFLATMRRAYADWRTDEEGRVVRVTETEKAVTEKQPQRPSGGGKLQVVAFTDDLFHMRTLDGGAEYARPGEARASHLHVVDRDRLLASGYRPGPDIKTVSYE